MGKDLKGKELGTGLRQRKDGRYEARAKINGIDINLYDVDLKKLKILFEKAKEEARNNIDMKRQKITLNGLRNGLQIIKFLISRKQACFLCVANIIIHLEKQ